MVLVAVVTRLFASVHVHPQSLHEQASAKALHKPIELTHGGRKHGSFYLGGFISFFCILTKFIISVDRDITRDQYDDEFVSLVQFVVLWRSKVSKTVENIVHRPALKKRRGGKLRSRNVYVDEHLGVENGKDTYADLEDFIVGDDDEVD